MGMDSEHTQAATATAADITNFEKFLLKLDIVIDMKKSVLPASQR